MKMRIKHLSSIHEQEIRITKLTSQLLDSQKQAESIKQEIFTLQHTLYELEQNLTLFQKQRQNLINIGQDSRKYDASIDEAETKGLELLETIEKLESSAQEIKVFQSGLSKTITEIDQEAQDIKTQENHEINNIDLRLTLLKEELPTHFRIVLQNVQAKNLAHGPFTRIDAGQCYFCRYKLSRLDESEIDLQQQLKQCQQCNRIFLPYGS
jgi:DNA repair ATPase RecN